MREQKDESATSAPNQLTAEQIIQQLIQVNEIEPLLEGLHELMLGFVMYNTEIGMTCQNEVMSQYCTIREHLQMIKELETKQLERN